MTLGLLASGREKFSVGPVTRLHWSELLCNKVLLKYKRDRESFLPGASKRNSALGKGHEEGDSAYAKAGSSLRKPPVPEHLPPKPESAYFTALCFHLHLWLYGGLPPTTSLREGVNLGLQLIKFLGVTRVFQFTNSSESSLACLTGSSGHMWLFTASQLWEAWDALNFLNTDSFEKLEKLLV